MTGVVSQTPYPAGATPLFNSSGNLANANAVATLTPKAGQTVYLTGVDFSGSGATAALVVNSTITGLLGGTWTGTYVFPAGVTSQGASAAVFRFEPPLVGLATDQAIVVTLPAAGAGGAHQSCSAYGYSL